MARVLPVESPQAAEDLVRESVHSLQLLGVPAQGHSCSVLQEHVARRIAQEPGKWNCRAIVLGSR